MGRLIRLPLTRRHAPPQPAPARAVVVSAAVGAGHDAVARELTERLTEAGLQVDRYDFLDLLPAGAGRVLVATYHRMLELAPWTWRLLYGGLDSPRMMRGQARLFTALAGRRMRRVLTADTRIVVSTYPLASQVLGRLRAQGQVHQPVHTYLTDFSVHRLWASPDVDAHLAVHQVPAGQAVSAGCRKVQVVRPLVDRRFTPTTERGREAARIRWGLPREARIALLVGGSWGAGELERTLADIQAADPELVCVVACGRNEPLRERLLAAGVRHAIGWTEDMPGLMHAADVLVQNAGGISVLEAVACGLPVLTYRSIPGHGLTNSAALDEAGVARWVRSQGELASALDEAVRSGAPASDWGADAVEVLLRSAGLTRPALADRPAVPARELEAAP